MSDIINSHPGLIAERKFTQPPNRYSDASLSKKCEEEQIARPATFANFIETLKNRDYIKMKGKSFEATELGLKVVKFLTEADVCFVDIKFTADMEALLDEIQDQKKTKLEVLNQFWTRLKEDIERGKDLKKQNELTHYKCAKCDGFLLKKFSKFGEFFSCQNYKQPKKQKDGTKVFPEGSCSYIAKVGPDGSPVEKKEQVKEYADFVCKNCGCKMVKRSSKHGEFFGCIGFPSCKTIADLNGVFKENTGKKKFSKFSKFKKKSKESE